jgi:hypothetical protein
MHLALPRRGPVRPEVGVLVGMSSEAAHLVPEVAAPESRLAYEPELGPEPLVVAATVRVLARDAFSEVARPVIVPAE